MQQIREGDIISLPNLEQEACFKNNSTQNLKGHPSWEMIEDLMVTKMKTLLEKYITKVI